MFFFSNANQPISSPKYQFLFHKYLPPRDFSIMTLLDTISMTLSLYNELIECPYKWFGIRYPILFLTFSTTYQGWRKVWKSGGVMGILCTTLVEIGLADLTKSGGAPPPRFRHPCSERSERPWQWKWILSWSPRPRSGTYSCRLRCM